MEDIVERRFIHGVDLDQRQLGWNLSIQPWIASPNCMALLDPGIGTLHRTVDSYPIDYFRAGAAPETALTPRAAAIFFKAEVARRGRFYIEGEDRQTFISEGERARLIKQAEIEVSLEEVRRRVAPGQVSRLSCIWMAERTEAGVQMINEMMGAPYIVNVVPMRILGLFRADYRWYDAYAEGGAMECAERYWRGEAFNDEPRWEYLLDGLMRLEREDQWEHIKANRNPGLY
jgi:hypothetical protein